MSHVPEMTFCIAIRSRGMPLGAVEDLIDRIANANIGWDDFCTEADYANSEASIVVRGLGNRRLRERMSLLIETESTRIIGEYESYLLARYEWMSEFPRVADWANLGTADDMEYERRLKHWMASESVSDEFDLDFKVEFD